MLTKLSSLTDCAEQCTAHPGREQMLPVLCVLEASACAPLETKSWGLMKPELIS